MKKYRNPISAVDVIIEEDDKIVLIERGIEPFKGKLALPGGHVDYGETVENAAVRESKEETGLNVKLIDIFGVYSDPKRDPRGPSISTVFIARIISGKLRVASDAKSAKFFDPKKLKKKDIAFDHYKIIQDYLRLKCDKKPRTFWSSR